MKILFIIFLIIGSLFSVLTLCSLVLAYVFTNREQFEKTTAFLCEAKHKKNVNVLRSSRHGAPLYIDTIKNLTRAKYRYTALGKTCYKRKKFLTTRKQTPTITTIIYHKRHPKLSFIEDSEPLFLLQSIVLATISVLSFVLAFSVM